VDKLNWTAKMIINHLPKRFKSSESIGYNTIVHFKLTGNDGGEFTIKIEDAECFFYNGLVGTPKCVIMAKDKDYEAIEKGKLNALIATGNGQIKVSNKIELFSFQQRFYGLLSSKWTY